MSLSMIRPAKHPKSGVYRIRQRIPPALRETAHRLYGVRMELIENLRTKEPDEARRRAPAAMDRLGMKMAAIEAAHHGSTPAISDRDAAALAGQWYRHRLAQQGDHAGRPIDWEMWNWALEDQIEPERLPDGRPDVLASPQDDADAITLLKAHGLPVDRPSISRVAEQVFFAKRAFASLMARRAAGDWSPDTAAETFPELSKGAQGKPKDGCTLDTLLEGWALDHGWRLGQKPIPRQLYDRLRTMERLATFLKHRDASRVTQADAVRWKEEMQKRGNHAATVRNDLSEMSAIWRWGLRNGKLQGDNPFAGISPPKPPKRRREARAFTDQEAATILEAARSKRGFLRWLPWVLCLTGARLAEIAQSAKEDVREIDGIPVLRIHDDGEGRSLKNADSRRNIPLHPALIAEGFLDYARALPAGSPLFPDIPIDRVFGQRAPNAGKRLSRWQRKVPGLDDARISPAHSFRHWFIGACRRIVMPVEVRSAITGHSAKMDESAGYGDGMQTMTQVLAEWMAKVGAPL